MIWGIKKKKKKKKKKKQKKKKKSNKKKNNNNKTKQNNNNNKKKITSVKEDVEAGSKQKSTETCAPDILVAYTREEWMCMCTQLFYISLTWLLAHHGNVQIKAFVNSQGRWLRNNMRHDTMRFYTLSELATSFKKIRHSNNEGDKVKYSLFDNQL